MTVCPEDGEVLVGDGGLSSLDPELRRGQTVGEYVIEGKLGQGTFGTVYRAIQPLIGKQVAIKVLGKKYSADPEVVSRFIAEARAVNQIRHKNIIDIFSFGQLPDGRHYHIMELLQGTTLDEVLKRKGRLEPVEALLVLRPLGRALDAAHAAGIAHRDLKPANIFVAHDDEGLPFPKLLDFGIAKLMTNQVPRSHQTATGAAVGTPDYMSPEQCQGANVDHRTDVYAFGIMTYQILTGRLPFVGENVVDVLLKQMTAVPRPPSEVYRALPPGLDAPILWMLEKDRDRRPADLSTAVAALEAALRTAGFAVPRSSITNDPVARSPVAAKEASAYLSQPPAPASARAPAQGPARAREAQRASEASLADPALSATLPTEARGDMEPEAPRSRAWAWWALAFASIGAGAAVGLYLRQPIDAPLVEVSGPVARVVEVGTMPVTERPPMPVAEPRTSTRAAEMEAKMPVLPSTVKLEIKTEQKDLEVLGPGGVVLGRGAGAISLPRGTEKIELQLRSPGYVPESREVVPLADGELRVALKKRAPLKPTPAGRPAKKQAGKDDIESFE